MADEMNAAFLLALTRHPCDPIVCCYKTSLTHHSTSLTTLVWRVIHVTVTCVVRVRIINRQLSTAAVMKLSVAECLKMEFR